jgi:DNA-binding NarL/FixJ family response regulator
MSRPTIRILVVDDFEPFRRLICSMLGTRTEFQVVSEASDGLEAVKKAAELTPDLVLLDIGLPTLDGIAAAREIRRAAPETKILFVSQESSSAIVEEALRLGTCAYVVKTNILSDLLAAVDAVLDGRLFVSGGLSGS